MVQMLDFMNNMNGDLIVSHKIHIVKKTAIIEKLI